MNTLRRALTNHSVILIAVCCCVAFYCIEWLMVWHHLSLFETIFSWLFLLLTIAIAWKPIVFSIVICVFTATAFLLPFVVHMPTIFWSAWVALGVPGAEIRPRWSIPIGVTVAASTATLTMYQQQMTTASAVTFVRSFLLANIMGIMLRCNRKYTQMKYAEQRQGEQPQLLSTLHDEVAGSLSYMPLLCRSMQDSPGDSATQTPLPTIIATLEDTLQTLRNHVTTPLSASTAAALRDDSHNPTNGYTQLCQNIVKQQHRLETAHFKGSIIYTGNPESQLENAVNSMRTELCNNIMKHGSDSYMVQITFTTAIAVRIVTINDMRIEEHDEPQCSNHGLTMLQNRVESLGGAVATVEEDNIWITTIAIPASILPHNHSRNGGQGTIYAMTPSMCSIPTCRASLTAYGAGPTISTMDNKMERIDFISIPTSIED